MKAEEKDRPAEVVVDDAHAPKKLSAAENVMLTVKVLAVAGALGALIWAVDLWSSGA